MSDFYLSQIKVVDGYPSLDHLTLRNNEEAVRHFIDRLYREAPREEWDAVHDILQIWSHQAQNKEIMFPDGKWVINLGGDKVRAPEL